MGSVDRDPKAFDPTTFNVTERRTFHDLEIGETYRLPSRTVTESHFAAFQVISGDNHPIHYDIEFCRRHLAGRRKHPIFPPFSADRMPAAS